jgi:pyruvate/2-oxoglutarate dehydrogenase complex dihydrolipoamide dehydrogenase (E3) component
MVTVLTPDICVIGAGPGGLAVAAAAAAFGVPVVLIEQGKMGGASLSSAVPSKALMAAADQGSDFAGAQAHVARTVAALALHDSAERFAGLGVRVIKGHAAFKDRSTVTVGDTDIRARRFVVATGSVPSVPPVPGLEQSPYFTGETIFTLDRRPNHLIVIGAGPHGLKLAQAFRRLGSDVTVLDAAQPLSTSDPEAAAIVVTALERDGVAIRGGVKIAKADCAVGAVTITLEGGETIAGTHLLVAAGRKANTAGLNLEAAGIAFNAAGIGVNKKLKTKNGRVYAIGDVAAGQPRSAQAAEFHAGLVIRHALFRQSVRTESDAVPSLIGTAPELAQVGLSEAEARKRGLAIRILRWPYHDNDRAQIERETHGHIKVITTTKGKIVGATIVGAQAGELISMWALAIAQNLNIRAMAELVMPYPTLSEIGKRAAIDYFTPSLTSSWPRRIIAWLRVFG